MRRMIDAGRKSNKPIIYLGWPMGYSFVEFRGQTARIHDIDLISAVVFLAEVLRQKSDLPAPDHLRRALQSWEARFDHWGPGCIDLELDKILIDDVTVSALRGLIPSARALLSAYCEAVPSEFLSNRLGLKPGSVGPVRAHLVHATLDQLDGLLSG